jgi:citrate lyase beta subunit
MTIRQNDYPHPDAGAVELNGRMIDAPHLKQALRLLSFAEASSQE